MKKKSLIIVVALVLAVSLSILLIDRNDASAQNKGKKFWYWRMLLGQDSGPYLRDFGLQRSRDRLQLAENFRMTRDQKRAMWEIRKNRRDQLAKSTADLMTTRRNLFKLAIADNPDQEAINQASLELAEALVVSTMLKAEIMKARRTVLTPEQLDAIRAFAESREKANSGFIEKMIQ